MQCGVGFWFLGVPTGHHCTVKCTPNVFLFTLQGRGTPEAKLGWAFSVFDQDKDGLVSREEMIVVVDAVYRMVGPAVKEMSEDVNTPQKRVDKLFRQAEKGKKEKLAFQDFCSIVEQDEAIWNILRCDMTNSEMVPM